MKVLCVVGDVSPISMNGTMSGWLGQTNATILPVLPARIPNVAAVLPTELKLLNATRWSSSVREVVGDVLHAAGIDQDRRLFISYRREEASELAEQLYDELTRQRFDVFLDRYSVEPGVNFQERLTEELEDKSMVLVLETDGINQSRWTRHEISFARLHLLGLLSVQLTDNRGRLSPDIDDSRRIRLMRDANGELSPDDLLTLIERVRTDHLQASIRRRSEFRLQLEAELNARGVTTRVNSSGMLLADPGSYGVWVESRPARLRNYFKAATATGPVGHRALLCPRQSLVGERRDIYDWLATRAQVAGFDPADVLVLAERISNGRSL